MGGGVQYPTQLGFFFNLNLENFVIQEKDKLIKLAEKAKENLDLVKMKTAAQIKEVTKENLDLVNMKTAAQIKEVTKENLEQNKMKDNRDSTFD